MMFNQATKLLTLVLVVVTALVFGMGSSRAGGAGPMPVAHDTPSPVDDRAPVLTELGTLAAPRALCNDDACDAQCIAKGHCEGFCITSFTCGCIHHLPSGFCP